MVTKYKQIAENLELAIRNNKYINKLPNERDLCIEFNVSRNTLNQALNILENSGLIYRKHGSGTYIRPVLDIDKNTINVHQFTDGFTYSTNQDNVTSDTKVISFEMVLSNEVISDKLNVKLKTPLFEVIRLRSANGNAVCYEINLIPVSTLPSLSPDVMCGSLFKYAQTNLNQKIENAAISITAPLANDKIKAALNLGDINPVVVRSQGTVFLESGQPLEFIDTYYRSEFFNLQTIAN